LETSTNDCVGLQEIYAIGLSSISISYAVRPYIHAAVHTPDRVTTGVEMSIPSNAMLGGKQEKIIGAVSSRYMKKVGRPLTCIRLTWSRMTTNLRCPNFLAKRQNYGFSADRNSVPRHY
jgi:hypothetical protein